MTVNENTIPETIQAKRSLANELWAIGCAAGIGILSVGGGTPTLIAGLAVIVFASLSNAGYMNLSN